MKTSILSLIFAVTCSSFLLDNALVVNGFQVQVPRNFAVPTYSNAKTFSRSSVSLSAENEEYGMKEALDEIEEIEKAAPKQQVKCPDCDKCDGSGRIMGGIGQVLPWWPIKAYRPCPNFIDRGGQYQRAGQDVDEILWGSNK